MPLACSKNAEEVGDALSTARSRWRRRFTMRGRSGGRELETEAAAASPRLHGSPGLVGAQGEGLTEERGCRGARVGGGELRGGAASGAREVRTRKRPRRRWAWRGRGGGSEAQGRRGRGSRPVKCTREEEG